MGVLNFFLCVYIRISFKNVHLNLNINIDFMKAHFDHDQAFNIMFMKETLTTLLKLQNAYIRKTYYRYVMHVCN
jgi:hypothetical protein